jgi:hypothetical protein
VLRGDGALDVLETFSHPGVGEPLRPTALDHDGVAEDQHPVAGDLPADPICSLVPGPVVPISRVLLPSRG